MACEVLHEDPQYERTILNPDNFATLVFLEHGLAYFPKSLRIKQILMKLYAKLGCS